MTIEVEPVLERQRVRQQNELVRSWRGYAQEGDTIVVTGANIMNIAVVFGLEVPETARKAMTKNGYRTHMDSRSFRRISKQKLREFGEAQIDFLAKLSGYVKNLPTQES